MTSSTNQINLTLEGTTIVESTRALFAQDADQAFRIFGKYLDENNLKISHAVINEYYQANRIRE